MVESVYHVVVATSVDVPDPSIYDHFLLRVKYDDAVGIYLNGSPVVLTSNLPNGENSAFNQYANGSVVGRPCGRTGARGSGAGTPCGSAR